MPNWVTNRIAFDNAEQYKLFKEKFMDSNGELDFNKIIPMPDIVSYADRICDSVFDENRASALAEEFKNCKDHKRDNDYYKRKEEIEKGYVCSLAIKESGEDPYNWKIANWGVKWGASEESWDDCGCMVIFDTPWGIPDPIYNKLAEMGFEFEMLAIDESNDWAVEGQSIKWEDNDKPQFSCSDADPAVVHRDIFGEGFEEYEEDWEETEDEEDKNN